MIEHTACFSENNLAIKWLSHCVRIFPYRISVIILAYSACIELYFKRQFPAGGFHALNKNCRCIHIPQSQTCLAGSDGFSGSHCQRHGRSGGRVSQQHLLSGRKNLGKSLSNDIPKTDNLEKALEATRTVLVENGFLWLFEPFKTHDRPAMVMESEDGSDITLVFRDCMIRQSLFRFGHAQKGSLCTMMNGFLPEPCKTSWAPTPPWKLSMPGRTPA